MRYDLCEEEIETTKHLFWSYHFAQRVYQLVFGRYNLLFQATNIEEIAAVMLKVKGRMPRMKFIAIWAACSYSIWRVRNRIIHKKKFTVDDYCEYVTAYMDSYFMYKRVR
ncbi:hypothetical protein DM860_017186 [Cuscuta australis]|uniref:Reverse transcriptase zinc-binding domain-containing protein n=1 Tax=Cuscuta australis TaxID=267555 RepID=A0A328DUW6_9ASTE|nr:hypothetical protein DM860_017186 [Cuscuta australis]